MNVEVAEELAGQLNVGDSGLQVAATYVTRERLLQEYLNRPYGNAYDFDQSKKIADVF